jgi:nicotinate-nucleotide adenylyltransferase
MAKHPRIHASDIETRLNTRYTADTIAKLKMRFPGVHFVWMMGADNLIQIPKWDRWDYIAETVPIAVFGRPTYSLKAMVGKAAQRYARKRITRRRSGLLADVQPPAWAFFTIRLHPASATALRAAGQMASLDDGGTPS